MRLFLLFSLLVTFAVPSLAQGHYEARITRDRWGIAHISGRTDADAVFGMIYAQAEDDFPRIEANYLAALGRRAEAEGEAAVWSDLRARMFNRPETLERRYRESPAWLRKLLVAWADGLNHYLATHPDVRPRLLTRFEPWMPLAFSEGSIGGDLEEVNLQALQRFYEGSVKVAQASIDRENRGSNGIAIAPRLTMAGKPLLLINPHTSFYFRSEQKVESGEGLNAYGAATWGQFFIYQGFNDRLGWMHTTSSVDGVDEWAETILRCGTRFCYRHGSRLRRLEQSIITLAVREPGGMLSRRSFPVYRTHHGTVVRSEGGRWVSAAMMHRPVEALSQGFLRTKARSFAEYMRIMRLQANSSNNTLLASAEGTIAFLYPQFVPKRSDWFDRLTPADGSDPRTDWQGVHPLGELPTFVNPGSGWVMNTNNGPYTAAGRGSITAGAIPRYMDKVGENPRAMNALELLTGSSGWTPEKLRAAAYSNRLPAFDMLLPPLFAAFDSADAGTRKRLRGPITMLRGWDRRWDVASEATTLAVHFGEALPRVSDGWRGISGFATNPANGPALLRALDNAVARLENEQGGWRVPWGALNRFQRIDRAITPRFDPAQPSFPVGFTSGMFGSLASFGTIQPPGSRQRFGNVGNSFVAVVEFGPRVRAMALSAGGQSGNPKAPHFRDQVPLYPQGALRPVPFYPDELRREAVQTYRVRS